MHLLPLLFQVFLLLASFVAAKGPTLPYDPSPFDITGNIDAMTLDGTSTSPVRGGTIKVNGLTITVPTNLLATLPSITVAWPELFKNGRPDLPQFGTVSWQANVIGNRNGNTLIAGLIYITPTSALLMQGFISAIDVTTGHFRVQGDFAATTTGVDCVLNDPLGRFGRAYTANPLWTVDPDNVSVRTVHGMPMCIPTKANDPNCPSSQRPNGETKITFDPPPVNAGKPDPTKMVPLVVGDYITFSGTDVGNGLIAVYSLQANVATITAAGTKPAYITVEDAAYAIVSGDPNLEDGETRLGAFTSDPTANVEWFAMDVDPCTGDVTERTLGLAKPNIIDPVGKTVFRTGGKGTKADLSPAVRQVGVRLSTGTSDGPGGTIAGQFIQPIFEYIFPELTVFGNNIPPNQFHLIPYLKDGSGPYAPGNLLTAAPKTTTIVGRLNPWPGPFPIAAAAACPAPGTAAPAPATPAPATPAPVTPAPATDTVAITSAVAKNGQGTTHVTCTATTNDKTATLFFEATGVNPVGKSQMTSTGNGGWSFAIDIKGGKPTTAKVTSDHGGSATQNF